ncbi:MAG: hypothetical protein PHW84_15585 [Methanosarcina sp.]|nr:hypothetical protein [Methanosarcina sp.]
MNIIFRLRTLQQLLQTTSAEFKLPRRPLKPSKPYIKPSESSELLSSSPQTPANYLLS